MFKWLLKPTLTETLQEYLEVTKLAASTVALTNRAWLQMTTVVGNIRINHFTRDKAEAAQANWQSRLSNTSVRMYRKSVSPIFSWALDKRYIREHPFAGIKMPTETKRRIKTFSPIEFSKLLQACDGDIRWIGKLLVSKTTGLRKSALQNLTRADLDFENELIIVQEKFDTDKTWPWKPKDRQERQLPMIPVVARIMTELLYIIPSAQPYIFIRPARYFHLIGLKRRRCLLDELMAHPISNFDRKFRKIKKRAGVTGRWHDLRSTCLTDLADVLNPNELALIAGHSDFETTMRYIGTDPRVVDKARPKVIEVLTHSLSRT